MIEFDSGPPQAIATLLAAVPDYGNLKKHFWYDWGPVFYRGRLDGSARVICVASDPGPTECLVRRTLVGDAGQRVQGFLAKIGLTHSYVCVNAFAYAFHPWESAQVQPVLTDPVQVAWRNQLFDALKTPNLKAVIAFGKQTQTAVGLWPGRGTLKVENIPHPSSRNPQKLLVDWTAAVTRLRAVVPADPGAAPLPPNYGPSFTEADYAAVPARDLPFGVPPWIGDDGWGRKATPPHNNCVRRPDKATEPHLGADHFLIWEAPK